MATMRCPQCGQSFDPQQSNAMPFCCQRCKLIDLGRWLNEEPSVPYERDPDEIDDQLDDEPPDPSWN